MQHARAALKHIPICLTIAAFVASAGAADLFVVDGAIQSIDPETKTITVKMKKGGEVVTVKDELKRCHYRVYTPGTMDDVQAGANLKVYGKVEPDLSAVNNVRSICVMPVPSLSTNKKSRIDGVLAVEGDKRFLERKDRKVPMTLKEKCSVSVVYALDFGFLEKGMHVRFATNKKDDYYVPTWSIRCYASREKAEEYKKSKESK